MPVCTFEQRIPPFDVPDRFIADEVRAGEVPLVTVDDAKEATRPDAIKAGKLGRSA